MARVLLHLKALLRSVAAIGLFSMMLVSVADVTARYFWGRGVFGAAEYIECLMVIAIFSGMGLITAEDSHVRLQLPGRWGGRHAARLRRWALAVFSIGVSLALTAQLADHALDSFLSRRATAVLHLPIWIMPASAAVLLAIGTLILAAAFLGRRGPEDRGTAQHRTARPGVRPAPTASR